jgi:hypothetical protein
MEEVPNLLSTWLPRVAVVVVETPATAAVAVEIAMA